MQISPCLSRRNVLAAVFAGLPILVAGCSDSGVSPADMPGPTETPTGTRLLNITANNSTTLSPTPTSTPMPTPTATATTTPPDRLIIEDGEAESVPAEFYERVVWEDTGRLVIEDGAGLELTGPE